MLEFNPETQVITQRIIPKYVSFQYELTQGSYS